MFVKHTKAHGGRRGGPSRPADDGVYMSYHKNGPRKNGANRGKAINIKLGSSIVSRLFGAEALNVGERTNIGYLAMAIDAESARAVLYVTTEQFGWAIAVTSNGIGTTRVRDLPGISLPEEGLESAGEIIPFEDGDGVLFSIEAPESPALKEVFRGA